MRNYTLVKLQSGALNQKRQELMKKLVHQVIQGYERGVPGMCKGETRTLTVPPHLAYGDGGYPGNILHFFSCYIVKYRGPILRVTSPALGSDDLTLDQSVCDEYSNFAGACAGHVTRFFYKITTLHNFENLSVLH